MPDQTRIKTINTIMERGLIARLGLTDQEELIPTVTRVVDGGALVVEIGLEGGAGNQTLGRLAAHLRENDPTVILGAGPVDDPARAEELISLGVDFLSGSGFEASVARLCNRRRVLYIPTAADQAGLDAAEVTGAEIVRYKAADPGELWAIQDDRPRSSLCPAGEAEAGSVADWFKAGACCVTMELSGTVESSQALWEVSQARGLPLFSGVEHVGLYPTDDVPARELVEFYNRVFGFDIFEGEGYYFAYSAGPGRIEVLEEPEPVGAHVAVKVRNHEAAVKALEDRGFHFEPVKDLGRIKAHFLKERDPVGNKVHLLYQAVL